MPLFFVAERPVAASVDVVALLGTAGYLTYVWSKVDKMAAWIMAPYLGWLGFATYLCVSGLFAVFVCRVDMGCLLMMVAG
jgi:benzodiazapine receptor